MAALIDPRRIAVLVSARDGQSVENKTSRITEYRVEGRWVYLRFGDGSPYQYNSGRVHIAADPRQMPLDAHSAILVDGAVCDSAGGAYYFDTPDGGWWHLFTRERRWQACHASRVEIVGNGAAEPRAAAVLKYWREVGALLSSESFLLSEALDQLSFVHPESVLHRYLTAEPIGARSEVPAPRIYPFETNLSQREAIEHALRFPISAIDGPPGTGKTQTILNLIANILLDESKTVAVVSSNNGAVDNVRGKLDDVGIGYVVANLGNADRRTQFLTARSQSTRNHLIDQLLADIGPAVASAKQMAALDDRLRRLQATERQLAQRRSEHHAYQLEREHFMAHFDRQSLPDPGLLPVWRWDADRILGYIADTDPEMARTGALVEVVDRITHWMRYRSMRAVDAADVEVVLRLQRLYFDKKIAELEQELARLEKSLQTAQFDQLLDRHREQSRYWLLDRLRHRYTDHRPGVYDKHYLNDWNRFSRDYPVVLSTCHSLQRSIGVGRMIDYLIIDEASQVTLLEAAAVLACTRNVVIVGDLQQLAHIAGLDQGAGPRAPYPEYDYERHSILSSVGDRYGKTLPRTILREHYRCDPDIIGFCNQKYYDDTLITFTTRTPGWQSMVVARTEPGNHMRRHRVGSRSNQREVDVIEREVLRRYCGGFAAEDIGVTTPYRKQVSKVTDALIDAVEADTIHRFQGREKDVIVMTTVLDETSDENDRFGLGFLDDPHMVNVAVSRAKKRFVLVTNNEMLPRSTNLRDLIGYIGYRNPGSGVFDSSIVSVFDLLYRDYAARLRPLAARVRRRSDYLSEDIIATVLDDLLQESNYRGLAVQPQVYLRNMLPDIDKLTPAEARLVRNKASVDFVVFNRVTKQRTCAIEVDGFEYHENNPEQLARDRLKNSICAKYRIPLLRLPTTGSEEIPRIRNALDGLLGTAVPPAGSP
ncbi:AAA family ATPase [Nocardia sp. SYP-A9097]|uniref:AAA domain-containing protein n=1 Tax=Nocardia sp. SYP-A9097 TaxID=2663237 RepID=UPI00129B1A65|nr:AAA domain-containing protein [Nocardia sp. SYP-A9097]MRH87458.1 AAA family ATPase [Nocardia sp. SYP-A9097]